MSRIKGGCLDWLSDYHFKEAHDFYWQRSSQQHCQHHGSTACDIVSLKILLTFLFKSCITGICPATLPAWEVIMPRYPPPHIKIISHRICANLRIDPKGRYKNGNPFKNGKLSSLQSPCMDISVRKSQRVTIFVRIYLYESLKGSMYVHTRGHATRPGFDGV